VKWNHEHIVIISLLVTGLSTVIIWVGLPILALTLLASYGFARAKKGLAIWQGAHDWEELPPTSTSPCARDVQRVVVTTWWKTRHLRQKNPSDSGSL